MSHPRLDRDVELFLQMSLNIDWTKNKIIMENSIVLNSIMIFFVCKVGIEFDHRESISLSNSFRS
jgi:hypothetical protein